MTNPTDDLERFRNPQPTPRPVKRSQRRSHGHGDWFLKGPIPLNWLQIASGLPGRTLHVGLAIWFLVGLKKRQEVQVTNRSLARFSVLPDAYRRGLSQLEAAGLVAVKRKPGCCARVTILHPPTNNDVCTDCA
ncbi:MAG: hypothetical protein IH899_17725 [Planctomycetes bacterium]|nr:hypothetical protein [Planctomycetota bacterium]